MSSKQYGVYRSLEEALQMLASAELSSSSEIKQVIDVFTKLNDSSKLQSAKSEKRHPFIVVEGLDGSGKSTLADTLAKKLGGVKMITPGEQFQKVRTYFDTQPNHVRRAFYSLSNYAAALEINEKSKECPVVLDRFWYSTAAYAFAASVEDVAELPPQGDSVYTWPNDLQPYPDIVFFLTVSEAKRMERLSKRSTFTPEEDRLASNENFRNVLHEAYRRMSNPGITEVNGNRFPKQILKEMQQIMKDRGLSI